MTPYAHSVSIPASNSPPPAGVKNSSSRYSAQDDSRAAAALESADEKTLSAKKNSEKDPSIFDELIASLLTRLAPAQPQVKEAGEVNAVATVAANSSAVANAGFSMEPALLVMPQDLSAPLSNIQTPSGDFTAELLAAMTPGSPPSPPATDTTLEIIVPVPPVVSAQTTDTTDTLSIATTATADSDPRLVACGFNPADMASLKEKFAGYPHTTPASGEAEKPALPAQASATTQEAATANNGKEKGIIAVTFTPAIDKSAAPTASASSAANSAVSLAVAQSTATPVPVTAPQTSGTQPSSAQTIAADAGLSLDMMLDGLTGEAEMENTATSPAASSADAEGEAGFDPVEFRIAQRFQNTPSRPVTQPQTPASMPAAAANTPAAANSQNNGANSTGMSHAAIKASATMPPATDQGMTMDTAFLPADIDFTSLVATPAGIPQGVTSPLSSPVSQNVMASQSHPAIHAAATAIIKGAKTEGAQTLSLRLDPPELGRLQVEMKYKKGDPLKVHVVLEKADTASMFQRDAHALENALKDAGLQTDGTSLSFELAKDGNSFGQAMGQQDSQTGSRPSMEAKADILTESAPITSDLDVFTDSRTGITHYNLRV